MLLRELEPGRNVRHDCILLNILGDCRG
jgi:hypothetical protein